MKSPFWANSCKNISTSIHHSKFDEASFSTAKGPVVKIFQQKTASLASPLASLLWRSAFETSSRVNKAEARLEKMQQRCLKNSGHASAESFKAFARVFTTCSIRKKKSPEHFKGKQKMSYNCLGGPSCDVVVHALLLLLLLLSCDAVVVVRWCRACVLKCDVVVVWCCCHVM